MKRLIDYRNAPGNEFIGRGKIIKFRGNLQPGEEWVDTMVHDGNHQGYGMSLIILSGHKSGLVLQTLPEESQAAAAGAICTEWLISNFNEWVADISLDDVFVCDRPAAAVAPFDTKSA